MKAIVMAGGEGTRLRPGAAAEDAAAAASSSFGTSCVDTGKAVNPACSAARNAT